MAWVRRSHGTAGNVARPVISMMCGKASNEAGGLGPWAFFNAASVHVCYQGRIQKELQIDPFFNAPSAPCVLPGQDTKRNPNISLFKRPLCFTCATRA